MALAFRLFAKYGFDEGVAGHITYRDPIEPTSFWVNPFGVPWDTIRASDLIRVDKNGDVVEGGECRLLNKAAYMVSCFTCECVGNNNGLTYCIDSSRCARSSSRR